MDITVEQQIPVEQPAPFQWPSGAAPCTEGHGPPGSGHGPERSVWSGAGRRSRVGARPHVPVERRPVPGVRHQLEPAGEPVAGHVRLLDASVGPVTWTGASGRRRWSWAPGVAPPCRSRSTPLRRRWTPLAPSASRPNVAAVRVVQWRVSGQQPMQGVTFHAPVDFYWIADAARKNQGVVVVAFPKPGSGRATRRSCRWPFRTRRWRR